MTSGTISLAKPKLKEMEEVLVNPHWLEDLRSTTNFKFFIKPNLQNILSQFNPKANCLPKEVEGKWLLPVQPKFDKSPEENFVKKPW